MVSKPVVPPWNDSSKNLVRDLVTNFARHRATILTRSDAPAPLAGVAHSAVYAGAGRFSPALADNARVLLRLLGDRGHDLWHFFFAPNPRTSLVGRACVRTRRKPSVQTVCSAPAAGADIRNLLFADRTVVLSQHSERLVLDAGVPRERVRRIPPAVGALPVPDAAQRAAARTRLELPLERPLIVYPGDLEYSSAAERMLRAHAARWQRQDAFLILACRAKTSAAVERERALRDLASQLGVSESIAWLGETREIHALLGAADVIALPAETLYAKMDLPLVVIEAMLLERCTLVAAATPAAELAAPGAALAISPDVDTLADTISALIEDPARRAAIGRAARTHALERFAPGRVAAEYESLYDELLA
jgi:glycosyltransferase involved in cell wall biosynthesis